MRTASLGNRQQRALLVLIVCSGACVVEASPSRSFTIQDDVFVKDRNPFQIISGRSAKYMHEQLLVAMYYLAK